MKKMISRSIFLLLFCPMISVGKGLPVDVNVRHDSNDRNGHNIVQDGRNGRPSAFYGERGGDGAHGYGGQNGGHGGHGGYGMKRGGNGGDGGNSHK